MKQIKNRHTRKVILEVKTLFGADLRNTDLSDADLSGSNLRGANLSNADLKGANLRNTDLSNTDLRNTDFRRADLYGADLRGANLKGTDLRVSINYYSFVAYDTSKRLVHCVKYNSTWIVLAGCFWGTLEELEKKVLDTHKSSVYLANIEILKTI